MNYVALALLLSSSVALASNSNSTSPQKRKADRAQKIDRDRQFKKQQNGRDGNEVENNSFPSKHDKRSRVKRTQLTAKLNNAIRNQQR